MFEDLSLIHALYQIINNAYKDKGCSQKHKFILLQHYRRIVAEYIISFSFTNIYYIFYLFLIYILIFVMKI